MYLIVILFLPFNRHKLFFHRLKTAEFHNNQTFRHDRTCLPRIHSFNTSSNSKNMTSIEISALTSISTIVDILEESPNLKKIKIAPTFGKHLCSFIYFYEALARSKLESVSIISIRNTTPASQQTYQMIRQRGYPVNSTVKELELDAQCQEDTLISTLLKCFSALTHFHLTIRSRELNLGTIFHHVCTIFHPTHTTYSIFFH